MKKLVKKEYCPLCGEKAFYWKIKPFKITYKGHSTTIKQPGFWCDACGDGVIEGEDNKATREEIQTFRSDVDGLLTPKEIYKIRNKVLHLTQENASKIFGGGINGFSRYERGEIPIPKPLSQLLRILKRHPDQLKEIKSKPKAS